MFGFFAGIKEAIVGFLGFVWTLVTVFSVGAVIGIAASYVGRINVLAAGVVGGLALIGAYYSGMAGFVADQTAAARIERLQQINDELARAKAAAEELAAFEQLQATALLKSTQERQKKLDEALAIIKAHEGDPVCGLSEEELDAIKELQK